MPYFEFQGENVFYLTGGRGPLLIILPGNTATSVAHQNEIDRYSKQFFSVSIDFLGTGKSDRLDKWPADWWEQGSHQVVALMDHLGYNEAALLGVSGGAIVAIAAAINYPERIARVVADSFSLRFTDEMFNHNVLKERAQVSDQQRTFWKMMHGDDWQNVVDKDTEMIRSVVRNGGACLSGSPKEIVCPVLLTFSAHDSFLPNVEETAAQLERDIRRCDVKVFSVGDHPVIWTSPTEFFSEVDPFLTGNAQTL